MPTRKRKLCLSGLATEPLPQCILEDKRLSPEAFMVLIRTLALFNYNWVTNNVTHNEGTEITEEEYCAFAGVSQKVYNKAMAELFTLGYLYMDGEWSYWAWELHYGNGKP